MAKLVSLKEVADALEQVDELTEAFLVRETGEILYVNEDDRDALDSSDDEDMPEWQQEHIAELQKVLGTDLVVLLPTSFDIHEWSMMENFCGTIRDPIAREHLYKAIHGKGAFRMFRTACERFRILDNWYAYRESAFEEIAREWLEENEIEYE